MTYNTSLRVRLGWGGVRHKAGVHSTIERTLGPPLRVKGFGLDPGGPCSVLLTYQLDGSVTDMLW